MVEATLDVILERLNNFIARNDEDHLYVKTAINKLANDEALHENRIRTLEDWKLVFVTKFSLYSALALIIGSFIATVINHLISKYL